MSVTPSCRVLAALCGAALLASCDSAAVGPSSKAERGASEAAPAVSQALAAAAQPQPTATQAAPKGHAAQAGGIKWGGDINWRSYEQGLAEAKSGNKPLCVVVYADWCPRCHELAQSFQNPELEALAKRVVMVRHNADQPGAWLDAPALAQHGKYVPRVFFFTPQGDFAPSITSGHPRYPFFYAANAPLALQQSIQAALKLSS